MPDDQTHPDAGSPPTPPEPALASVTSLVDRSAPTGEPPTHQREFSALDDELDVARSEVIDAFASWLVVAWEQPILRAIRSNAGRALDNASAFPALRAELTDLQSGARHQAEDALTTLLDSEAQVRDRALINSVEVIALQLVGAIAGPMKDAGFDPLNGGLERTQDGYRCKVMIEHDQINEALRAYLGVKATVAAERLALIEHEREDARVAVERLWEATADRP